MSQLFRFITLNAARVIFVATLLLALYFGLNWALAIEDRPDAALIAAAEAARNASESSASELAASVAPEPTTPATEAAAAATATPTPTVDPQELIAAALPPPETSVQVLDAGGGGAAVDSAVSALEQIGYNVVNVTSSTRKVDRTTVYFTADDKPQADGLQARDPRFQVVEANRGLNEGVNLHVLVGPGF